MERLAETGVHERLGTKRGGTNSVGSQGSHRSDWDRSDRSWDRSDWSGSSPSWQEPEAAPGWEPRGVCPEGGARPMSGVSTSWPWPECPLEQLPLGQGCIYGRPISTPSEMDDLGSLEHVEWRAQWKYQMAHPVSVFQQALAAKGISYLTCTLCSNDHAFEHCSGPRHYGHIWKVKGELVIRGVGYVEGRDYFWQVVMVGRELAMRFNHLDGAIEGWRSRGMLLGPLAQLPEFHLAPAPAQMQGPNLPPPSPPIGAPPCGDRYPPPPPLQPQRAAVATVAPGHPGSSAAAAPMAEPEASGWLEGKWPLRVSLSSEEQIDIIGAAFADKLRGELRRSGGLLEVVIQVRPCHGVPARPAASRAPAPAPPPVALARHEGRPGFGAAASQHSDSPTRYFEWGPGGALNEVGGGSPERARPQRSCLARRPLVSGRRSAMSRGRGRERLGRWRRTNAARRVVAGALPWW